MAGKKSAAVLKKQVIYSKSGKQSVEETMGDEVLQKSSLSPLRYLLILQNPLA